MKQGLIFLIFIVSFFKGLLGLFGLPSSISQLIIEFLIAIFIVYSLGIIIYKKKLLAPKLGIFSLLILCVILSYLSSDTSKVELILFLRYFFIYPLFFYSLMNIDLSHINKKRIFNLLLILCSIQILASVIKLILLGGPAEDIIGTMSLSEGSLATIMPLFPITFLVIKYLDENRKIYLIYILMFIGIGLMSLKMGILAYVIMLFIYLSYFISKPIFLIPNFKFLVNILKSIALVSIILVFFIKLNPRANPENEIGGSIDFDYLLQYTENYQTLDLDDGVDGNGRFDAPFVALNRLSSDGILTLAFGFGPGVIVKSSFAKFDNPLLEKFNIGYGGRLGFVWLVMQIGLIGTIIYLLFHVSLFYDVFRRFYGNSIEKRDIIYLLSLGLLFIFFLDFFTYSTQMILNPVVSLMYYFSLFLSLSFDK